MLGSLGVEVPYKVVRLSRPPSSFIMEAGDVCAKYERKKLEAAAYAQRGSVQRGPAEMSVERPHRSDTGDSGMSGCSTMSSWRADWRPHAHPMQRSHFSASHPGSMVLGSTDGPISENAMEIQNHRKLKRHPSPRGPHPLDTQHYANRHKGTREALRSLSVNRLPAAGAPSEKVTRMPVPSDITARSRETSVEPTYQPAVAVVTGPKLWTAERDRRERERERSDCVVGRERVLRASSPPKEVVVPEGPKMWTAERDLRNKRRSSSTPNHHLVHQHKKLYGEQKAHEGRVGVQPSDLQTRWGEAGWWQAQSSPNEVRTKPEYVAPSPSTRAIFGVPNYSHRGYEATEMSMQRRQVRSPSTSRKWRP
eukprot:TRINITY_DN22268_c0_g1_i1.p1 TRINITY_DN22268_c0_g1~~TRINITY_DN22268_c0_g1_i1.p1  ORF type:complete len:386 (+),score=79.24 TRINITY_DN22268_c0_g1_i1:64-1158(+)